MPYKVDWDKIPREKLEELGRLLDKYLDEVIRVVKEARKTAVTWREKIALEDWLRSFESARREYRIPVKSFMVGQQALLLAAATGVARREKFPERFFIEKVYKILESAIEDQENFLEPYKIKNIKSNENFNPGFNPGFLIPLIPIGILIGIGMLSLLGKQFA